MNYYVEYKISGTIERARVIYEDPTSGSSEELMVDLPWSYSFNARKNDLLLLAAKNLKIKGTITAEIIINGVVSRSSTSAGAFVTAKAGMMV